MINFIWNDIAIFLFAVLLFKIKNNLNHMDFFLHGFVLSAAERCVFRQYDS